MAHHPLEANLLVERMRDELTTHGFTELRSPAEVEDAFADAGGTMLLMINSVCGCAAGAARPGVVRSLQGRARPDRLVTVFAGQDREATAQARAHLTAIEPTSPSVVLLRDGQPQFVMHRQDIEGRDAEGVAAILRRAYEQHCA